MTTKRRKYAKTGTRNALIRDAFRRLESAGVSDWQSSAEWLVCDALDCSRVELWSRPDEVVSEATRMGVEEMLARRLRREPVQYILGHTEFMGLRVVVNSNVLIPRPETELLVERALQLVEGQAGVAVLDIGTGSGCVALAFKHFCPEAYVTACDNSDAALDVARTNSRSLRLDVQFVQSDVLEPGFPDGFERVRRSSIDRVFDLIVSNPPYVPESELDTIMPEVRDHEPHEALFVAGDALLFYRAILSHIPSLLEHNGSLLFEVHTDYAGQVAQLLTEAGFDRVAVRVDLAGRNRFVEGRWRRNLGGGIGAD